MKLDATKCPNPDCGSDDIEGGTARIEGNVSYQNCWCWKCHTSWVDKYQLIEQTDILIPARFLRRA